MATYSSLEKKSNNREESVSWQEDSRFECVECARVSFEDRIILCYSAKYVPLHLGEIVLSSDPVEMFRESASFSCSSR